MKQLFADFRVDDEEQAELNAKLNKEIENKSFKGGKQIKEALQSESNRPNLVETGVGMITSFIDTRQEFIDKTAQTADDVVTGGLKKVNMPGAEFLGDRARNITGFATDLATPEIWELPLYGAAAVEPTPFGEAAVYGVGVRKRLLQAQAKLLTDEIFAPSKRFFSELFSKKQAAVTPEGVEVPNTFFMSKSDDAQGLGSSKGFSKATSPEYANIVKSGMKRMGMEDDVFDLDLYDLNSPILSEMADPLGGTPMKSGQLRSKKLTKRNWLEYFLTPESLKGNFEALKKAGKVDATQTWEGFLKSKGLKTQAIQAHHINPLYDSIHLFDGVKWGSDEYWEMVTTLIDRGARPGITEREGVSNIIRTLGASARTDTPHGVAHEFYRDIMPTFFNQKNRDYMKLSHKNRMEMTKRWATIVNRSENIVYEAHKAWEVLNPEFRIDFNELVERMAKYDNQGVLKGVHTNYQVPDIRLLVQKIQYEDFLERLMGNITPVKKKNLPLVVDNRVVDELNQEFLADLVSGKTKKELTAKWGKKYNLKAIGAKQLNFFDDIRKLN